MSARFSDEQLRVALAGVAEVAGDGSECPDTDLLVTSGRGELEPGPDRPVLLHIARCTACAMAWRVARDVAAPEGSPALSAPSPATDSRNWTRLAAAAAIFVVALGLGVLFWPTGTEREPVYRTQEDHWLQSTTEQDQPQPRDRFVLSWTAGPEGSFYDVRVMSERLEPLAGVRGLDRPEFRVPEDVLAELPSGARILWQVTAHLPDARTVESDTFFALVE